MKSGVLLPFSLQYLLISSLSSSLKFFIF
jgi:hypothetical protein